MSTLQAGSEAVAPASWLNRRRTVALTVLPVVLALLLGHWWDCRHKSLYGRYDRYARTCLAGTVWGPPPGGWVGQQVQLGGPVRLLVTGSDPAGTVLTFTAPSRIGHDPLRPVDEVTRQVLAQHACPA